jgi:hypothetical protein
MRTGVAYLLVYIAGTDPNDRWADIGHDPDFREHPFTWGICRTDVRGWAQPGDDLFFIAKAQSGNFDDRYFLRARFSVAEKINPFEARRRFGTRDNVIVDELPPGDSLRTRVVDYVKRWEAKLNWEDGKPNMARLGAGAWDSTEFVAEYEGRAFIHSYWDPHIDWKRRLESDYVVADPGLSAVLSEPIPWLKIASSSQELPPPARLTNKSHRHAAQRVGNPDDLGLLRDAFSLRL